MNTQTKRQARFFSSLRGKLTLWFLGVALLPLTVAGFIAYGQAQHNLIEEIQHKLEAVRDIKAMQIEGYFQERLGDLNVLAHNPVTIDALQAFRRAVLEDAQKRDAQAVLARYREHYLGRGEADVHSTYGAVHGRYHPVFKSYMAAYGYYDVFLVDAASSLVLYNVSKEADFGTNLRQGAYADSSLAATFRKLVGDGNNIVADVTVLQDFAYYGPTAKAAAFVAAPIIVEGQVLGMLAFQLSTADINAIMQERTGMGQTGETYLLGEDKLMRSDSRFAKDSTILQQKVETPVALKALNGVSGVEITQDYRNTKVLSAYRPLHIPDVKWVILAEIDESEALRNVSKLAYRFIIVITIFALISIVIALWVSHLIAQPVQQMTDVTLLMAQGDLTGRVTLHRDDEIGIMADASRHMAERLEPDHNL
jgi:methyl-accepting chemotaxis protein